MKRNLALIFSDPVAHEHIDWIDTQFISDLVEKRRKAEHRLRIRRRPIVGSYDGVGMNRQNDLFEVGNVVEIRATQITALLSIGAHVGYRVQLDGCNRAVFFYADLVMLLR